MVQLAIAGYNRQNNVDWETMPSTGGCMRNVTFPGQPELALSDLTRSINIAPSANAYVARATIYRQRHNVPAAVSDLRAALELEPNNSNIRAALGYALWDSGDIAQSREMLEQAHKGLPDDPALIRQLAYVNQRLDDMPATQHYARLVIDDIDNQALITPLTPEQKSATLQFPPFA